MAALQQIGQMRGLMLGINTLGNIQFVATCRKLILSDLQHTSTATLPKKPLPSSSPAFLVSHAAHVLPVSFPWSWTSSADAGYTQHGLSGDLTRYSSVPPQPTWEVRGLMS